MPTTPYQLCERFLGLQEIPGAEDHPLIVFAHNISMGDDPNRRQVANSDEVPWCSSWVNMIMWMLRLPRSKSRMARSWLDVGEAVPLEEATVGYDIVIFSRGSNPTAGHVTFYAGMADLNSIRGLGANQGNSVKISNYPVSNLLGVRRILP